MDVNIHETIADLRHQLAVRADREQQLDYLLRTANEHMAELVVEREKWKREALQQYPTPEAYDAACKALEKHRTRADDAELWVDRYRALLSRVLLSPINHKGVRNGKPYAAKRLDEALLDEIRQALSPAKKQEGTKVE